MDSKSNDNYETQADAARDTAILNMAFDFASMARVFQPGTKDRFLKKVRKLLVDLADVGDSDDFDILHDKFCQWGRTAIKPSRPGQAHASYGQIAKTLNVVLKAAVYYCDLLDAEVAAELGPWLHPAIDTPMMAYLRRNHREVFPQGLKSIAQVDKRAYRMLLDLAVKDIEERFDGEPLYLVQWEDIVWGRLNGKT